LFILHVGFAASFALWFLLALSPLQRQYFPTYLAIGMTGKSVQTAPVWWIWKTGPKRKPLLALDADVVSSKATSPKELPLALSPEAQAAGWTGLVRMKRFDRTEDQEEGLRDFFAGESLGRLMITPLCGAALLFLFYLGIRIRFGSQTSHEERHGRRTKGPELVSALTSSRTGRTGGNHPHLQRQPSAHHHRPQARCTRGPHRTLTSLNLPELDIEQEGFGLGL
jgi:hypothetical protein